MATIMELTGADWGQGGTIIMDDGCVAYTTVIKTTEVPDIPPSQCVVCKETLAFGGKDLYSSSSSTTQIQLSDLLSQLVVKKSGTSVKFTNTMICNVCCTLLDRADRLRHNIDIMKTELKAIIKQVSCHLNVVTEIPTAQTYPTTQVVLKSEPVELNQNDTLLLNNSLLFQEISEGTQFTTTKQEYEAVEPHLLTENVKDDDNRSISCKFCPRNRMFKNRNELANHFDDTHSHNSHVLCRICEAQIFGGIKHFLLHMASTHPDRPIKQGLGTLKVSTSRKKIKKLDIFDSRRKRSNKDHQERVKRIISKQQRLKCPIPALIDNKSYKTSCPFCNKPLSSQSIRRHIAYFHSNEKTLKCNLCPESFVKRYHFHKHLKDIHGIIKSHKEKRFMCQMCNKFFHCEYVLRKHGEMVHENRRDYLCNICGIGYKTPSALKVHLRRHTGARPYTCNVCGKNYTTAGSIKKHVKRVHNVDVITRLNDPINNNKYITVDYSQT